VKTFRVGTCAFVLLLIVTSARAQQVPGSEPRVSLSEPATASDVNRNPSLEARLITTSLNGSHDSPVTNIRMALKNVSTDFLDYVSGVVTFYDASGMRCGEGIYKADVLAPSEVVETDTPGIRIRCVPSTWRIVINDLVPRTVPVAASEVNPRTTNLRISIDGQEHPIQIGRPLVLTLGDVKRTIVVRTANR
jgi:hypothetical protein